MRLFICFLLLVGFKEVALAVSLGDGSDGSPSISGVVNIYTSVSNISSSNCVGEITVASSSGFQVGDLIIILQMQGASINNNDNTSYGTVTDIGSAGSYEYAKVFSVVGNVIETLNPLLNAYDVNGKVQLVNVPQYSSPTITGSLTCQAWNGSIGGILAIDATGTIIINSEINVSGLGFRGGVSTYAVTNSIHLITYVANVNYSKYSQKGEGIAGYGVGTQLYGRGAPANGAGGGNAVNAGGGGGAGFGCGGLGGWGYDNPNYGANYKDPQGIGGYALPYNNFINKIFLGGAGGAGHNNDHDGTNGGNGGGIIILTCNSLNGNINNLRAEGNAALMPGIDGAGGGGSGGTILLSVENYLSNINVNVAGGDGGDALQVGGYKHGPGGGGGGGLIWVEQAIIPIQIIITGINGGAGGTINNDHHGTTDGCIGSTYFNLEFPVSNLVVTPGFSSDTICDGETIELELPNGSNYSWSPSTSLSCDTCQNTFASPNQSTIYIAQYQNGPCIQIDTFEIIVNPLPILEISNDTTICEGNQVQLFSFSNDSVSWSPSTGLNCTNCFSPIATPSITITYVATTTSGDCSTIDSVKITVIAGLLNILSNDTMICEGETIQLDAAGSGELVWTPSSFLSCDSCSNPIAIPDSSIEYYAVNSVQGCDFIDSLHIQVYQYPILNVSNDTTICIYNSVQLYSESNYPIQWDYSQFLSCTSCNNPIATPNFTSTFYVESNNVFCAVIDSVTISVLNIIVDAGKDTIIIEGQSVILNGSGAQNYSWSPSLSLTDSSIANPIATPESSTTYYLVGISENGCKAIDSVKIIVVSACDAIFIPNAFSPNNDGVNDYFKIISLGEIKLENFRIYNRWGQLLFESENLNDKWNGTFNGIQEEIGVYVYVASIDCGEKKTIKGNVTLVR